MGDQGVVDVEARAPTVPRRRFVRNAFVGSAIAGAGISTLLQSTPARAASDPTSYLPGADDLHMLRRATWGPTPELDKQIGSLGVNRWLDQQLNPGSIDDHACITLIADRFPRLAWTLPQAYRHPDQGWPLMLDLGIAAIARAAWSKRQLFEVMVDFWSNHLNVTNSSDNVWWSRHDYDRAVIRRHALGKFSDMLARQRTHPAMLTYLNNAESTKDDPNENYGRELLELHTVGVDAGYTEDEMRTSALILTGFGVHWYDTWTTAPSSTTRTTTTPGPCRSSAGPPTTATRRTASTWRSSYVDYLAHHPATAHRIAFKLCERFVSDAPPAALVDAMANAYLAHDTAIVPGPSPAVRVQGVRRPTGEKVSRPMQDVIATLRILGIRRPRTPAHRRSRRPVLDVDEHERRCPWRGCSPTATPTYADAWRSAGGTLNRWNTHLSLAAGWYDNLEPPDLRKHPAARHAAEGPRRARPDARQAAGVPHAGSAASRRPARVPGRAAADPAQCRRPKRSDWRLAVPGGAHPRLALSRDQVITMSMTKPRPTLDAQPTLKPCGCPHMPAISRRNFLKATGAAGSRGGHRRRGHVHAHGLRRDAVHGRRPGGALAARRLRRAERDRAGRRRRLRRLRDAASEHRDPVRDS